MKYIAFGLVLVMTIALLAGCVQTNEEKYSATQNISNQENTEEQISENTNITYENISDGSDLNDTTEVGYLNEESPF